LLRPAIFRGTRALIEENRAAGYRNVLVSGSLDFAIAPLALHLGLDDVVANRLVFRDGVATGEIASPVIAESAKVAAMEDLARRYHADRAECRAYSDSHSDLPMLEAVGLPSATNPDRRLTRVAKERGWPVLHLK
jgi:HAD superfamily hydrolase (TIGR01490 family)